MVSFIELYQDKFYDLFDKSDRLRGLCRKPLNPPPTSTPGLKQEASIRIQDLKTDDGTMSITISGQKLVEAQTCEEVME